MSIISSNGMNWFRQFYSNWGNRDRYASSVEYMDAVRKKTRPGIPVWWFTINVKKIETMGSCPWIFLICQKDPDQTNAFWLLAVPKLHLLSLIKSQSVILMGKKDGSQFLHLELSPLDCTYQDYSVKRFDDIWPTYSDKSNKPVPLGQFLVFPPESNNYFNDVIIYDE